MATTHTVKQGETLSRIAKHYKFANYETLYNHPDNAEFKKKRPNPNIIFPGDQIVIPTLEKRIVRGNTNASHTFRVKKPDVEKLRMVIQSGSGKPWTGKRVVMKVGNETLDVTVGDTGLIEMPLPKGDEKAGELQVFMDASSDQPTHVYELQIGSLDPVEELSGVQARCNMLGYDCGVADGIMGGKTREGVKAFQAAHGLDIDGVPGPKTKAKLKEVYGC